MASHASSSVSDTVFQEAKSENAKTELENSKKAEKERVKKISTSEKTISQIREQLDNPPKVEDLDVINDDMVRSTLMNGKAPSRRLKSSMSMF